MEKNHLLLFSISAIDHIRTLSISWFDKVKLTYHR